MGIVYRATDTRLDRVVAIKALPESATLDADRRERFEREARTLASLNHPNIAQLFGLEIQDGQQYLVMEFVEGETLQERLANERLSIDEALEIALQIAHGLEAAHDAGVIHRDLKPGNVKITPEGKVKILDFGLARADTGSTMNSGASESPTLSIPVSPTIPGAILGTAPYMSPEQARGRPIDKRTDIWSFGVVLHECLTGRGLFQGETATDSIAAILERETSLEMLPERTPRRVRELIVRCLEKDRGRRLRDIGDARLELEQALADREWLRQKGSSGSEARWKFRYAGWFMMAIGIAIGAIATVLVVSPSGEREVAAKKPMHFELPLRTVAMNGDHLTHVPDRLGITPDGSAIVIDPVGDGPLIVRELNSFEVRVLEGTDDAHLPRFSPDGQHIAYKKQGRMHRVSRHGGPPMSLFDLTAFRGWGTWGDDGSIYAITDVGTEVVRFLPDGWTQQSILKVGDAPGHLGFESIFVVPGEDYALVDAYFDNAIDAYRILAVSLRDGTVRTVLENAAFPHVTSNGVLYFTRDATLFAAPFDIASGQVTGASTIAIPTVRSSEWGSGSYLDISWSGTIAYLPGERSGKGRRIVRVNQQGDVERLGQPDVLNDSDIRVSPNGRFIAVNTMRRGQEAYLYDIERDMMRRISISGEAYSFGWTHDSETLLFNFYDTPQGYEQSEIMMFDLNSGESPRRIRKAKNQAPVSLIGDGTSVLITQYSTDPSVESTEFLQAPIDASSEPQSLFQVDHYLGYPRVSPNGQWLACISYETDTPELIIHEFPPTGRRWHVSRSDQEVWLGPFWSADSSTLYWVSEEQMFAATITESPRGPEIGPQRMLFSTPWPHAASRWDSWDMGPDGNFYAVEPADWEQEQAVVRVIVNFDEHIGSNR